MYEVIVVPSWPLTPWKKLMLSRLVLVSWLKENSSKQWHWFTHRLRGRSLERRKGKGSFLSPPSPFPPLPLSREKAKQATHTLQNIHYFVGMHPIPSLSKVAWNLLNFLQSITVPFLRWRCIGSTQHLKNKYGSGYSLEIKIEQGDHQAQSKLDNFVKDLFPGAVLSETFGGKSTYKVPKENVSLLSSIFAKLEEGKRELLFCYFWPVNVR